MWSLQLGEELRVRCFGAAARAEDRPDERGDGDDVVDGRRRLHDVVRGPVRVDAVGLGLCFGDDLAALLAVGLDDEIRLVGEELLGLRARHERLTAGDETERVDAGHVGDCDARRTATQLEQ